MTDRSLFYGTKGPRNSDTLLVGESWGREEASKRLPFVGSSGQELDKILAEVGIAANEVLMTNVVPEQPPGNDMWQFFYRTDEARSKGMSPTRGLFPMPNVVEGVKNLHRLIDEVRPKRIIGFGNYTLWALTQDCFSVSDDNYRKVPRGIGWWRGSQLYTRTWGEKPIPFLPTYHPAAALKTWPWRYQIVHDLRARAPMMYNSQWDPPEYNFTIRPSYESVIETLDYLLANKDKFPFLAHDLESPRWCRHIACWGIAWSKLDAICIPFMCNDNEEGYWSEGQEVEIVWRIRKLMEEIPVAGQNFLYDAQYVAKYWQLIPTISYDTMIMQHLCYPGTPLSLNHISSLHCAYHRYWKDEGKILDPKVDENTGWAYNCKDVVATYEAVEELIPLIKHFGLMDQFRFQQRQMKMILNMMIRGVKVDRKRRAGVASELMETIMKYDEFFSSVVPPDVYPPKKKPAKPWYRSYKQQAELFYDILGEKPIRKKGARTLNDEALETIGNREPLLRPLTQMLQEYRSCSTFSNFCKSSLDDDDRMRCEFTPTASTFRWKSNESAFGTGGNLQNIPEGSEEE